MYSCISTFSGAGGSCEGYRRAGFRVLWANEFIESARDTYVLNHPSTVVDSRDIREVDPYEVMRLLGLERGELDLLDGSPPCASFSTSGAGEKSWGEVKSYSETEQRTDDLFHEYIRFIDAMRPKVFIAENVSGLNRGAAKELFEGFKHEMRSLHYSVSAELLDASYLGVSQMRKRIIFIGVRSDLVDQGLRAVYPSPELAPTVNSLFPYVREIKMGGRPNRWKSANRVSPTIMQSDATRSLSAYLSGGGWIRTLEAEDPYADHHTVTDDPFNMTSGLITRKFSIDELKIVCGFPSSYVLTGTYAQQWERLGRAVPPEMMRRVAETIRTRILDMYEDRHHELKARSTKQVDQLELF